MADRILFNGSPTSVVPLLVLGVSSSSASRNIVHRIIGRARPEVTLAPPEAESGQIELLFADAGDAADCVALHRRVGVFSLDCSTQPAWSRRYVVDGAVDSAIDPETRERWTVTIGYRAVPA